MKNLINAFENMYPGYLQKTAEEIMEKTAGEWQSPWWDVGGGLAGGAGGMLLGAGLGHGIGALLDKSDRETSDLAGLLGGLGAVGGYLGGGMYGSRFAQQPYLNQPQA